MELKPIYKSDEINEPILISEEPVIVKTTKGDSPQTARIVLEQFPKSRIRFHIDFKDKIYPFSLDDVKSVVLTGRNNLEWEGFAIGLTHSTKEGSSLTWSPRSEPLIARGIGDTEISYAVFHIFNFKECFGPRRSSETRGNSMYAIFHFDLVWKDWHVEIKSLTTTSETIKQLEKSGGYGLTHIGSVKKKNDVTFKGKELKDILYGLRLFLSFAKGTWCPPVLCIGFNKDNEKVWESWNSPHSSWQAPMSWHDAHHGDQLTGLFPKFMDMWSDEIWKDAIQEAIYWYISANDHLSSIEIEKGIILSQTALERLAYEYAVNYKRLLTPKGFKDLWASDKFRLLFSSIDIPIDIPDSLKNLKTMAAELKWIDAPHGLTEIRNSMIHPDHKHKGKFNDVVFEAWKLSLWYLELAILRICGYEGTYSNRLVSRFVGEAENVPWK